MGEKQRTVVIFDTVMEEPIRFFVVDGDYSHLHHVYINSGCNEKLEDELRDLLYDDEMDYISAPLESFPVKEVTEGAKVIAAGYCP